MYRYWNRPLVDVWENVLSIVQFLQCIPDGDKVWTESGDFLPADSHEVKDALIGGCRRHGGTEPGVLHLLNPLYNF